MSGCRSCSQAVRFSIRCLIEFTFQVAMRMKASGLGRPTCRISRHAGSRFCSVYRQLGNKTPVSGVTYVMTSGIINLMLAEHESPAMGAMHRGGGLNQRGARDTQTRALAL